jgi:hypothetical protein
MRLDISPEAAEFARANGGQIWVWAAYPRRCCAGAPAWMHAATVAPDGLTGFTQLPAAANPAGVTVYFRGASGVRPDVLEIAVEGKRHPKIAAYWDGCLMAMT